MSIVTARILVVGGAPRVKLFTAPAPGWITISADGSSVYLGNNTVTPMNGFKMGQATITLKVDGGDEIWAISTSDTVLSLIAQPD